ncbi:hypothetical protein P175DRAFT_0515568 [Aspergillus ochraceoroseus IBT 24754]|uniref:Uncharacterized protein n=3 Tax=Aspergillus subgen. Nidulantes TaxID=2720870 RepID=A0A0F8XS05_9EURO|nr:uncharacterized protein P175DRAFT_0515568 [Aspergillus ochraceoroseus IBT 24754]KKK15842.1 hypothetical protein AOCH_007525 [Aspergillus ochraceoroseus]KKK26292.1 hypothetical protein ARAM_003060 [Aspergillus rambellii]PTU21425.1 hypothetical protein P175DRAFT_0515568 [Aspergillus ochraceoroseus IBT 24754]
MTYKSNYEPYTSQSFDLNRLRPSEELLYPLGTLYPHVVALQMQSDDNPWSRAKNFSGYHDTSYWAEVSSPRSLPEHYLKPTPRRYSDSTASRFVSRIRRFLSRDDMRRRQRFE